MAYAHATQLNAQSTDQVRGSDQDRLEREAPDQSKPQALTERSTDQGMANVDKIRDILFGSQIREYESRFARLEERLALDLTDLRSSTGKRLEAIETYAKSEFASLQEHVKSEREDRVNSLKQLARDLTQLGDTLTQRINELDEKNVQADRQARLELLQLSKNLNDEVRSKQEEFGVMLDRRLQELRNTKMDRAAMATLLIELATRLSGDLQLPAK
jgi:hypothetical protein